MRVGAGRWLAELPTAAAAPHPAPAAGWLRTLPPPCCGAAQQPASGRPPGRGCSRVAGVVERNGNRRLLALERPLLAQHPPHNQHRALLVELVVIILIHLVAHLGAADGRAVGGRSGGGGGGWLGGWLGRRRKGGDGGWGRRRRRQLNQLALRAQPRLPASPDRTAGRPVSLWPLCQRLQVRPPAQPGRHRCWPRLQAGRWHCRTTAGGAPGAGEAWGSMTLAPLRSAVRCSSPSPQRCHRGLRRSTRLPGWQGRAPPADRAPQTPPAPGLGQRSCRRQEQD